MNLRVSTLGCHSVYRFLRESVANGKSCSEIGWSLPQKEGLGKGHPIHPTISSCRQPEFAVVHLLIAPYSIHIFLPLNSDMLPLNENGYAMPDFCRSNGVAEPRAHNLNHWLQNRLNEVIRLLSDPKSPTPSDSGGGVSSQKSLHWFCDISVTCHTSRDWKSCVSS